MISENYQKILAQVGDKNKLLAVTKYSEFEDIKTVYDLGHRDFGENRVESLMPKAQRALELGLSDIRWHFIGHIQSNKIAKICQVPNLKSVQSLDNLKHMRLFNEKLNSPCDFYIQVNTSGEEQKGGLWELESVRDFINQAKDMANIRIVGLMTMAAADGLAPRLSFQKLVDIRDAIDKDLKLSMGMSGDMGDALELGSDCIRVGSAIFKG
ncbi:YggS family pyridoxal phosphate-dependent enzyme [Halobacteriovorax sp. HFRX-2_2]|uniref:YggS family pyridoxal phosphate-dependent enzyme n=1 Tax=unclassified Halobacteriovorax TaxID=2639665 RepID=UPI0037213A6B